MLKSVALKNWLFSQVGGGLGTKDGEWLSVSSFPTTVHLELVKLGRIPDPVSFTTFTYLILVNPSGVHRTPRLGCSVYVDKSSKTEI